MKNFSFIMTMLFALVGLQASAAIYIVGNAPFGDWNPANGTEMTDNGNGIYTLTKTDIDMTAGTTLSFKVVKDHEWGTEYPMSNYEYTFDESGVYTLVFTFNPETHEVGFTATKTDESEEKEEVETVYILGEVNENSWDPTNGVQMTYNSETGKYTADVITYSPNTGYSYFSFTKALADSTSETPWEDVAAYRFGAVSEDYLVDRFSLGDEMPLDADGTSNAFKLEDGEWTFTLDLEARTLVVEGSPYLTSTYYGDVYVLGEVNDNGGWFPNVGSKMTRETPWKWEHYYTITITTKGENDGYSYFSFTKALAENDADNGGWEEIDSYRIGAPANDYEVTEELLGQQTYWTIGDNAFKIAAGTWNVTLSIDVGYVIIEKGESYLIGDVNHDGEVNITDVTLLIDRVLAGQAISGVYDDECDIDGDDDIAINDVTALIDLVLAGGK